MEIDISDFTDEELEKEAEDWDLWKAMRGKAPEPIRKSLVDRSIPYPYYPSPKRSVGFFKSYSPRVVSRGRKFFLNLKKSIAEITEVKNCEEIWRKTIE